jgi:hypothetical protein
MGQQLLTGLVSGGVPFLLDAITGGSSSASDAQDDYLKSLADFVARLKKDAGKSVSDSLFYKTSMNLLNEKYGEDIKRQAGLEATMGTTQEGKVAAMDQSNRARNNAQVKTLGVAEEKRNSLLDKASEYELAGKKTIADMAGGTQSKLAGLAPMATSGLTSLISMLTGKSGGSLAGVDSLGNLISN